MPFAEECEMVERLLNRLDGAATESHEKNAIARAPATGLNPTQSTWPHPVPVGDDVPGRVGVDALFTRTTNLMWHLHATSVERGLNHLADDLLVALAELEFGP